MTALINGRALTKFFLSFPQQKGLQKELGGLETKRGIYNSNKLFIFCFVCLFVIVILCVLRIVVHGKTFLKAITPFSAQVYNFGKQLKISKSDVSFSAF